MGGQRGGVQRSARGRHEQHPKTKADGNQREAVVTGLLSGIPGMPENHEADGRRDKAGNCWKSLAALVNESSGQRRGDPDQ